MIMFNAINGQVNITGEKTDYISLTKQSLTKRFRSYGIGFPRVIRLKSITESEMREAS